MRLSLLAVTALFAVAFGAPAPPEEVASAVAGSVVTNKGVTYEMQDLGQEIRAFAGKVDDGEYPHPVTYKVNEGFECRFYLESSRGVGAPIGEFTGSGDFGNNWVAFYACWHTTAVVIQRQQEAGGVEMIPCGFTLTANGGNPSLSETGKNPARLRYFAINGIPYVPVGYRVVQNCTCRFYGNSGRGGAELIKEVVGLADGDFEGKTALQYECWIGK
ncbi:hypothetical protein FB567DRAFT_587340 [Paraphoma chrysanthemicola]|uniref:Uncharacterized protein n=1 Tax=Paraphoma chrysanthemicola TaxID=798071 RepID=A0A8K0RKA5_9PLEO|nr:hypothetical protein FB567DRAFT_587340 [Paraphoma chrysanthemicola]